MQAKDYIYVRRSWSTVWDLKVNLQLIIPILPFTDLRPSQTKRKCFLCFFRDSTETTSIAITRRLLQALQDQRFLPYSLPRLPNVIVLDGMRDAPPWLKITALDD